MKKKSQPRIGTDGTRMKAGTLIATDDQLVRFIRTYSEPIELKEAARDLARLGKYGAAWPRVPIKLWETRLREMAASGKLVRDGQLLSAPPLPIETESLLASGPQEEPTPILDYISQRGGIAM